MNSQIVKPQNKKEEEFIADQVVSFYKENPEEVRTNSYKKIRESVRDLLQSDQFDYFLITTQNNEDPVGIIQTSNKNGTAEIILIYIKPEHRNKGIGSDALNKVNERLEKSNAEIIKTEINTENDGSQRFFESMGFKKHSVIYIKEN